MTVDVAEWIGNRLRAPGAYDRTGDTVLNRKGRWPEACWGENGQRWRAGVSAWPMHAERGRSRPFCVRKGSHFRSAPRGDSFRARRLLPAVPRPIPRSPRARADHIPHRPEEGSQAVKRPVLVAIRSRADDQAEATGHQTGTRRERARRGPGASLPCGEESCPVPGSGQQVQEMGDFRARLLLASPPGMSTGDDPQGQSRVWVAFERNRARDGESGPSSNFGFRTLVVWSVRHLHRRL